MSIYKKSDLHSQGLKYPVFDTPTIYIGAGDEVETGVDRNLARSHNHKREMHVRRIRQFPAIDLTSERGIGFASGLHKGLVVPTYVPTRF